MWFVQVPAERIVTLAFLRVTWARPCLPIDLVNNNVGRETRQCEGANGPLLEECTDTVSFCGAEQPGVAARRQVQNRASEIR